ncbi:MAG: putative internalin [Myxococcales bacterium]|nr:putative internalin [Myxococcales bacterium]
MRSVLFVSVSLSALFGIAAEARDREHPESAAQPEGDVTLVDPLAVVQFSSGSTKIDDETVLDDAVQWQHDHPLRLLVVEGHADRVGNERTNLALSQRRMELVRDELVRRGADPTRLIGAAYGEMEPAGVPRQSRRVVVRGTIDTYENLIEAQRPGGAPDQQPGTPTARRRLDQARTPQSG